MPFTYKKIFEQGKEGIEITGFDEKAVYLSVPAEIEGLPVLSIGTRAFAGREDLREVSVPDSVERIRAFAFYSCINLEVIRLSDGAEDYYDGVIRRCVGLKYIEVRMIRNSFVLLKSILGDSESTLHFHLLFPGEEARLIFPGYNVENREDFEARAIHVSIHGSGYSYREAVMKKAIDFQAYDRTFSRAVDDNRVLASMIAIDRLQYPYSLGAAEEAKYREFVRKNAKEILLLLVENRDPEGVAFLSGDEEIGEEAREAALQKASAQNDPEICAILMEYEKTSPKEPEFFSFDD